MTIYQRKEEITMSRQTLTLEEREGFSLNKVGTIILEEY